MNGLHCTDGEILKCFCDGPNTIPKTFNLNLLNMNHTIIILYLTKNMFIIKMHNMP